METIGIVAEYNPFHNGHLYMLQEAKKLTGAKNVVVVMSGDFVQRGAPAWTDKYLRTKLALAAGVDMVFELPVCYATASAEPFAAAGVNLLHSLGFVEGICFGSEYGKLEELNQAAEYLATPPASFDRQIKELTAAGASYPTARMMALPEQWQKLVSFPNTTLGIEYLKEIKRLKSPLIPIVIKRTAAGHHDTALSGTIASATAIRAAYSSPGKGELPENMLASLPESSAGLLKENWKHFPVTTDDFSLLMYYRLSQVTQKESRDILDMTPELYNRIQNLLPEYDTLSSFTEKLKTRQFTYSRISRVLLHCLLGIKKEDIRQNFPLVPYARLLGFRKEKSGLLREVEKIPVITKPSNGFALLDTFYDQADTGRQLSAYGKTLLKKDFAAANIYRQVQRDKLGISFLPEECQKPVIFP